MPLASTSYSPNAITTTAEPGPIPSTVGSGVNLEAIYDLYRRMAEARRAPAPAPARPFLAPISAAPLRAPSMAGGLTGPQAPRQMPIPNEGMVPTFSTLEGFGPNMIPGWSTPSLMRSPNSAFSGYVPAPSSRYVR